MSAVKYINKFGLGCFEVAMLCPQFRRYNYAILYFDEVDFSNDFIEKHADYMFGTSEIKRLVESHVLVMDYYGLARAKEHAESDYTAPEVKVALKQAIADVESCL